MRALLKWFTVLSMSMFLLTLLVSGCGRSSLEPEDIDASASSSGSSGTAMTCGPSNCANGCCDGNGVCQTGRNVTACGSIGGKCSNCQASGFDTCTDSRVCARSVKNCGLSNCPTGCCATDAAGKQQCLSGTESTACGRNGSTCNNCEDDGRACDLTTRSCGTAACDASNCNGCCVGDLCLPGNSAFACGANGGQCGRCDAGEVCRITSVGGGTCQGATTCGPANCGGCCTASGKCLGGLNEGACGRLGQRCDVCSFDETCIQDGQPNARTCQQTTPTCGPGNCDGCCFFNKCVPSTDSFCGIKGSQCSSCAGNETCSPSGTCDPTSNCGPLSCGGCCIGDICAVGSQATACGANGGQCSNCLNQFPTRTCQSGSCQLPSCGPTTCPTGCCSGNICVTGTQDNACGGGGLPDGGGGGKTCTNCTASGQACVGRQCVPTCGPANCNGCCDGNICRVGNSSTLCGGAGEKCDNCLADGTFCNSFVFPRRCNNEQNECPAAYSSCPAGVTIPKTPVTQKVCTTDDLDQIEASCDGSVDDFFCQLTLDSLSDKCSSCITPFNHPFAQSTGLFECAASEVLTDDCRRKLGCASDCAETSCEQCFSSNAETTCRTLVNNGNGQCQSLHKDAACANDTLAAGQLCSQFSYPDYNSWLRAVGDHFCGAGP